MGRIDHHIGGKSGPRRALGDLASRQYGVAARRQVIELGIGRRAIDRALASGTLRPVHRGVYAVGHSALTARGRWMAAVLACGEGAVLSHRTAAALWGLRRSSGARIDVTVPRTGRCLGGIAIHRTRHLPPDHVTCVDVIPVTSVARTLLDLCDVVRPPERARAIEEAERLRIFDLTAVESVIEASPGRHGVGTLIAAVRAATAPEPTREELERLFLELCRAHGIPLPAVNIWVEGFEVDACWQHERLIVELDGWEFHRTRAAFERDRRRDAVLQLAGYRVLRVSWRWLQQEPAEVANTIHTLLQAVFERPPATAAHS